MKRRIGIVTVGRSDYGIYYPLLRAIQADPECDLCLIVGGAHLSLQSGTTISEIERDSIEIAARVPMSLSDDSPASVAASIGLGVINFASMYTNLRPDIVVLLGDRYEMLAAAIAALPLRIPVAHIHGGELTEAALDDSIRHSISKLSHLHFASAPVYGRRLEQMGEQPERVFVSGTPVIDAILAEPAIPKDELAECLGVQLDGAILVTYHPVTLQQDQSEEKISVLLDVLSRFENELIFTYPNADSGSSAIIEKLRIFVARWRRAHLFMNLGRKKYHNLQRHVAAMVGNSSSGIIEAASFRLPVVNIGDRQKGRLRTPNIVDVPEESDAIEDGIRKALSLEFRESIVRMESPYGSGNASKLILDVLRAVPLDGSLLTKKFNDWQDVGGSDARRTRSITQMASLADSKQ